MGSIQLEVEARIPSERLHILIGVLDCGPILLSLPRRALTNEIEWIFYEIRRTITITFRRMHKDTRSRPQTVQTCDAPFPCSTNTPLTVAYVFASSLYRINSRKFADTVFVRCVRIWLWNKRPDNVVFVKRCSELCTASILRTPLECLCWSVCVCDGVWARARCKIYMWYNLNRGAHFSSPMPPSIMNDGFPIVSLTHNRIFAATLCQQTQHNRTATSGSAYGQ